MGRAVLCGVTRARRLVGLVTLLALVAIAIGVTGIQLPTPGSGASSTERPLPGVRAATSDVILRPGGGAPPGSELGFMAVEPSGNLVVSDQRRDTVMRFDPSGHLLTEWGPRLGDFTLAQPAGVAVAGETIYVLDRGTPRIFRLDGSGRALGSIDLQPLGTYGLNGLAVDAGGALYAADTGRNRILVLSPTGDLLRQVGRGGADLGAFTQPMNVAFAPDASFFVADWENGRIERFDSSFNATDAWTIGFRPFGVAVDQLGRVFAPDSERRVVEAFTPRGASLGELGGTGSAALGVSPRQLAFARSPDQALYVLGDEGIAHVVLENTPPPPQGGSDVDVVSLAVIALLIALVVVAFVSRRRRRVASLGPLNGPVRLHAENGAQRQDQQPRANEHLLVADQSKREHQTADQHDESDQDAEARHHV